MYEIFSWVYANYVEYRYSSVVAKATFATFT